MAQEQNNANEESCVIIDVSYIPGGYRVTFEWTDGSGHTHTETMDVMSSTGPIGKAIVSVHINPQGHLIVYYDDGTFDDAGYVGSGGGGGGGGSASWGQISGNINNQNDLQVALHSKAEDAIEITWAAYQALSESEKSTHRYIITDYPDSGGGTGGVEVFDLYNKSDYDTLPADCIFRYLDNSPSSSYKYGHVYIWAEGMFVDVGALQSGENIHADFIDHVPVASDFDLESGLMFLIYDDSGTYRVFAYTRNTIEEAPEGTCVVCDESMPSTGTSDARLYFYMVDAPSFDYGRAYVNKAGVASLLDQVNSGIKISDFYATNYAQAETIIYMPSTNLTGMIDVREWPLWTEPCVSGRAYYLYVESDPNTERIYQNFYHVKEMPPTHTVVADDFDNNNDVIIIHDAENNGYQFYRYDYINDSVEIIDNYHVVGKPPISDVQDGYYFSYHLYSNADWDSLLEDGSVIVISPIVLGGIYLGFNILGHTVWRLAFAEPNEEFVQQMISQVISTRWFVPEQYEVEDIPFGQTFLYLGESVAGTVWQTNALIKKTDDPSNPWEAISTGGDAIPQYTKEQMIAAIPVIEEESSYESKGLLKDEAILIDGFDSEFPQEIQADADQPIKYPTLVQYIGTKSEFCHELGIDLVPGRYYRFVITEDLPYNLLNAKSVETKAMSKQSNYIRAYWMPVLIEGAIPLSGNLVTDKYLKESHQEIDGGRVDIYQGGYIEISAPSEEAGEISWLIGSQLDDSINNAPVNNAFAFPTYYISSECYNNHTALYFLDYPEEEIPNDSVFSIGFEQLSYEDEIKLGYWQDLLYVNYDDEPITIPSNMVYPTKVFDLTDGSKPVGPLSANQMFVVLFNNNAGNELYTDIEFAISNVDVAEGEQVDYEQITYLSIRPYDPDNDFGEYKNDSATYIRVDYYRAPSGGGALKSAKGRAARSIALSPSRTTQIPNYDGYAIDVYFGVIGTDFSCYFGAPIVSVTPNIGNPDVKHVVEEEPVFIDWYDSGYPIDNPQDYMGKVIMPNTMYGTDAIFAIPMSLTQDPIPIEQFENSLRSFSGAQRVQVLEGDPDDLYSTSDETLIEGKQYYYQQEFGGGPAAKPLYMAFANPQDDIKLYYLTTFYDTSGTLPPQTTASHNRLAFLTFSNKYYQPYWEFNPVVYKSNMWNWRPDPEESINAQIYTGLDYQIYASIASWINGVNPANEGWYEWVSNSSFFLSQDTWMKPDKYYYYDESQFDSVYEYDKTMNPSALGWYEMRPAQAVLTQDTSVQSGKGYCYPVDALVHGCVYSFYSTTGDGLGRNPVTGKTWTVAAYWRNMTYDYLRNGEGDYVTLDKVNRVQNYLRNIANNS